MAVHVLNRTITGLFRAYSIFVARVVSFTFVQVSFMQRGTQINYMPDKCQVIIINAQGQIVQTYFIRKDCLT